MRIVKIAQNIKDNLVLLILLIRALWLKFIDEVDDNWNDLLVLSSCSCIGKEFKIFVKTGSLINVFFLMVLCEIFSTKSFKSCFVNIWSFNSKWTLSFKLRLLTIWPLIFLVPLWSVFVFLNQPSNGKQSDKCKGLMQRVTKKNNFIFFLKNITWYHVTSWDHTPLNWSDGILNFLTMAPFYIKYINVINSYTSFIRLISANSLFRRSKT